MQANTLTAPVPASATTAKTTKEPTRKSSGQAKLLGSGTAGLLELLLFHPIDTAAKRLMSNQKTVFDKQHTLSQSFSQVSSIVFKGEQKNVLSKYLSLLPGLGFAAGYKISQRIYKFGGQPLVMEYLEKHHSNIFDKFGSHSHMLLEATAGSLIGIGEIILLPLDVLKIKSQTNIETLGKRSFFTIVKQEGLASLYKGAFVTALRNAPGSFALFGGSAFTREKILHREPKERLSFFHYFICSTVGAFCSLLITNPMDVVKTRVQNKAFQSTASGFSIAAETLKNEGVTAFFKGLTPKLLAVGPKLVFSFTIAQYLISKIDSFFPTRT